MTIDLKEKLDELVMRHNRPEFILNDPVQFPHRYSRLQDIETVAFLTATLSWGNRASILKSVGKMLSLMGDSPFDFIMNGDYNRLGSRNIHRTFFEHDLLFMCRGLRSVYEQYSSLEEVFAGESSVWDGIGTFRTMVCLANGEENYKHISNPGKGSACKRIHMALRWLVRQDGIVDLGVWKNINPAGLFIPLDTHVARISRELGILNRKTNDRRAVEELTSVLRLMNPADPVIYDFALFGTGEENR